MGVGRGGWLGLGVQREMEHLLLTDVREQVGKEAASPETEGTIRAGCTTASGGGEKSFLSRQGVGEPVGSCSY